MKAAFSIAITPLSKNAGDDKYRTTHKKLDRMKKTDVYQTVTNNIQAAMEKGIQHPKLKIFRNVHPHMRGKNIFIYLLCPALSRRQ